MANKNNLSRQLRRRHERALASSLVHGMRMELRSRALQPAPAPTTRPPRRGILGRIRQLFTRRGDYGTASR